MSSRSPWEIDEPLRPERLQVIARAIARARDAVADLHQPEDGDNAWSLGCRAYVRTCWAVSKLFERGEYEWLRVKQHGLKFTTYIGDVPMKFYRGEAEQPTSRTLRSAVAAKLQSQGRLEFVRDQIDNAEEGFAWMMAIDTDDTGRTLEIVVFQADAEGNTRHPWLIPILEDVATIALVSDERPDAPDQEPAGVELANANDVATADDVDDELGE